MGGRGQGAGLQALPVRTTSVERSGRNELRPEACMARHADQLQVTGGRCLPWHDGLPARGKRGVEQCRRNRFNRSAGLCGTRPTCVMAPSTLCVDCITRSAPQRRAGRGRAGGGASVAEWLAAEGSAAWP